MYLCPADTAGNYVIMLDLRMQAVHISASGKVPTKQTAKGRQASDVKPRALVVSTIRKGTTLR